MKKHCISISLLALLTLTLSSGAEEDTLQTEALPEDITTEHEGLSEEPLMEFLQKWREVRTRGEKEIGLDWTASYYSIAMGAALGNGVPVGASGDFTVQGIWAPGRRWSESPLELRFRVRYRHAYGGLAASQLGPDIGALWGLVDGFSNSGLEVPDFYLRHAFKRSGIEVRYGQLSIDSQFGGNQLASSKQYFFNQGFASDPVVAFPRFGAGLTLFKTFENGFTIGLGTTTVQGTKTGDQVDFKFSSGDLFQALQLAYDFKGRDDLSQRIQLLAWHSDKVDDAVQPEGQGVSLTYERALSEDGSRMFARFSWGDGGATPLDYLLTAGYARPCGESDFAGIAAGMGRGSSPDHDFQMVLEAFYRWKLRDNFRVSPDIQLLIGEGLNGGPGVRLIGGIRAALTF
jgi:hypothetical protein